MTVGWLPAPVEELFGPDAAAEESYEVLTVDVPPTSWIAALETARDALGCTYFDWLSAVDEPGTGFRVAAHVVALPPASVRRLLVRTTVSHATPVLASAVSVYAGARWHERETHEMFGVHFEGHPGLDPLLLPEGFEGHPLRKDFVLAARVVKAWPGAKEPGESEHGGPKRRQMLPPGVPDPNEWGPLKGQLPPAPARPARGTARAAGDRPVRRARSAGEGSASQATAGAAAAGAGAAAETSAPPRRARSASQGSASQQAAAPAPAPDQQATASAPAPAPAEPTAPAPDQQATTSTPATPEPTTPAGPRRTRSASQGSASQRAEATEPTAPATPARPAAPRSADAPWHHARPAFDEPKPESVSKVEPASESESALKPEPEPELQPERRSEGMSEPGAAAESDAAPAPGATPEPASASAPEPKPEPKAESEPDPDPDLDPEDPSGGPQ